MAFTDVGEEEYQELSHEFMTYLRKNGFQTELQLENNVTRDDLIGGIRTRRVLDRCVQEGKVKRRYAFGKDPEKPSSRIYFVSN